MTKIFKWLAVIALGLVLLFLALAFALHRWVSTDDFKQRVTAEASTALGVPVALGSIRVDMWPVPAVAFNEIRLQTTPAITVGRLEVRPQWQPLLQGQWVVATLMVRQAVLPQAGLDAVLAARLALRVSTPTLQKQKLLAHESIGLEAQKTPDLALKTALTTPNEAPAAIQWLPRRVVLDDVTWVNTAGAATALDGQASLAADGLPDRASLTLIRGNLKGLQATLERQTELGAPDHQWALQVDVGGGKVTGPISLQLPTAGTASTASTPNRPLQLQAKLQTQGVDVAALTAPNTPLSGLLDASTTVTARAATTAELGEALQTATTFTVRHAVLNGLDLAKAVKTVGMQRGGQTRLDTLTGHITTQGRAAQLKDLVASSGALTANGNVNVTADKALSGRIDVALAGDSQLGKALGGAVGIPLTVGGTVAAPQVTLERSALIGGVLGTLVLPGAGTAGGLKLGGKVGEGLKSLFGNK
jgi:hypothetical protein